MTYLASYYAHVICVALSISFFTVRGYWMLTDNPLLDTCPGFGSVAKYVAVSTRAGGISQPCAATEPQNDIAIVVTSNRSSRILRCLLLILVMRVGLLRVLHFRAIYSSIATGSATTAA